MKSRILDNSRSANRAQRIEPGEKVLLASGACVLTGGLLAGVAVLCGLLLCVALVMFSGDREDKIKDLPPPRQFLLSEDALPEGWWAGSIDDGKGWHPLLENSVREASREYQGSPLGSRGNDWAAQNIGVYSGEWSASEDFRLFVKARIDDEQVRAAPRWAPLAEWNYVSPYATQYRLVIFMKEWHEGPAVVVRVVAQYDRYVTLFGMYADPNRISPEEIKRVVRGLDEAFASLYSQ